MVITLHINFLAVALRVARHRAKKSVGMCGMNTGMCCVRASSSSI